MKPMSADKASGLALFGLTLAFCGLFGGVTAMARLPARAEPIKADPVEQAAIVKKDAAIRACVSDGNVAAMGFDYQVVCVKREAVVR